MKIKPSLVALSAVVSLVLLSAPTAGAQEKIDSPEAKKAPVTIEIKSGDTLSSIADAHSTTYVRIFNANDFISNPDLVNAGDKVRIPTADEQLPDRYAEFSAAHAAPVVAVAPQAVTSAPAQATAPRAVTTPTRPITASSAGNTYYAGYCTWYAKDRRPDLPNMLGNGGQWVANAAARGFATGSTPRVGAIAEMPGHVAYVEAVNGDGTITLSEMNGPAGFGVVGTRTAPASQFQYIY